MYEANEDVVNINTPWGIEVVDSEKAYFVNHVEGEVAATLAVADLLIENVNQEDIE